MTVVARDDAVRTVIAAALSARRVPFAWMDDERHDTDAIMIGITLPSPAGACNLIRTPTASEGGRMTMLPMMLDPADGAMPIATAMEIRAWADGVACVHRREAALKATGHAPHEAPAWSLRVHPLVHHLACRDHADTASWLAGFTWTKDATGWIGTTAGADGVRLLRHGTRLLVTRWQTKTSDWTDAGMLCFEETEGRGEEEKANLQTMVERMLPQTVVAGSIGRDLSTLVSMRGIPEASGVIIRNVAQTPDITSDLIQIDIGLRTTSIPLAPAPVGVARDWLPCTDNTKGERS